jgi:hypothetical protein
MEERRQGLRDRFRGGGDRALQHFLESLPNATGQVDPWENPAEVRAVFGRCFEVIATLERDTLLQLEHARRDRSELTRICADLVTRLLDELGQIDVRSNTIIGERAVRMVEIGLPVVPPDLRSQRLQEFLDRLVRELQAQGLDSASQRAWLETRLYPTRLLHEACDLRQARIKVRKPAQAPQKPRLANWEEVPGFSGGEKYLCYFALYLSLMTYIRGRRTTGRTTKVILADNPFGRMSADFLLEGMFTLARLTHTQMVCFTALKETTVLQSFPRLFSMVLRANADGREVMDTRTQIMAMETGRLIIPRQEVLFF